MVYMGKVSSKYRDEVSFQSVPQASVLSHCLSDTDAMYEVQCSLAENEDYRLFNTNPLHMGFFLDHIVSGNTLKIHIFNYSTIAVTVRSRLLQFH